MRKPIFPIVTFVVLQLIILTAIILWIIWNVLEKRQYNEIVQTASNAYGMVIATKSGHSNLMWGLGLLLAIMVGSAQIFIGRIRESILHKQRADFFSAFTHELMTPITAIQVNLETMQAHTIPRETQEKLLLAAHHESKRLQNTIDNILEFTRMEHRKKTVQMIATNLDKFLEHFVSEAQQFNPEVQISYKNESSLDITALFSAIDARAFTIVLNNLLKNAIKYSSSPAKIDITLSGDKKKSLISFRDYGQGIKKENQKKVFQVFYRANQQVSGVGLGLYVAKNIIKLHGGQIFVESAEPGSIFFIKLPRISGVN